MLLVKKCVPSLSSSARQMCFRCSYLYQHGKNTIRAGYNIITRYFIHIDRDEAKMRVTLCQTYYDEFYHCKHEIMFDRNILKRSLSQRFRYPVHLQRMCDDCSILLYEERLIGLKKTRYMK
jgi:RNase P subunit RPR2